jgi:hypothetical protein
MSDYPTTGHVWKHSALSMAYLYRDKEPSSCLAGQPRSSCVRLSQSQRLVTSMLGLQCDFLGSLTRRQERQGLACDVGPSSHSPSTVHGLGDGGMRSSGI